MKKFLIPIAVVILLLLVVSGSYFFFFKGKKMNNTNVQTTSITTKEVIFEKNPYIALIPRSDGHEFKLEVTNLTSTELVEYELAYMAGDFSRGAIGEIQLTGSSSFTRNLLLGSESCSGNGVDRVCKYRYDEGVTDGTLTLRLRRGSERQKIEIPFRLQKGNEGKKGLASSDGNFTFKGSLPSGSYYAISSTQGLPKPLDTKILSGPYGIFTTSSNDAKGTVEFKLSETATSVKVLGWVNGKWVEFNKDLKINDKTISATVDELTTFVVVAP